jgi:tight adherence protein B
VTALVLALVAGAGTFLLYTGLGLRWGGLGIGPAGARNGLAGKPALRLRAAEWLAQAGLDNVNAGEFIGVMAFLFATGALAAWGLFDGLVPAIIGGAFAATFPVAAYRSRRQRRQWEAREAWPRLIEELRLLTGSLGRSIPQALFEVGRHGPTELRGAFAAAEREWLMTTDFERTVAILKARLADATADAVCETLLVAHELGGSDLDRRLAALAEDRVQDVQGRKDALAKQAGVRFARKFVLVVPLGMALAGMSIGPGRTSYRTPLGQVAVAVGLGCIALCWMWASRMLRLPDEARVFRGRATPEER